MTLRSSQSGGIFIYILIGIVLFAALGFALSRNYVKTDGVSDEKTKLLATEIIAQGNQFKDAVTKLRLRGIPETQISFENTVIATYANSICTIDDCKIFKPAGGGMTWQEAPQGSQIVAAPWGFSGTKSITYASTSSSDLIAILPNLTKSVCEQIDKKLDSTAASTGSNTFNLFTGTYGGIAGTLTLNSNQRSVNGCLKFTALGGTATSSATANSYAYVHVLLFR